MKRQSRYEVEAKRLISEGDRPGAVAVLQRYVDENCERVEEEYRMLNQTLQTMLETLGVEYLYVDYVKDWTASKGVPLPLQ
jgi:hypothetical protein